MREINYMISGFCACAALFNFLVGQPVMFGVTLFFAVFSFYAARGEK